MHGVCFFFQAISAFVEANDKTSHFHSILNMTTVPLYQFIILKAYSELRTIEDLAAATKCGGVSFAQRRMWIYVEILGFWVNLL